MGCRNSVQEQEFVKCPECISFYLASYPISKCDTCNITIATYKYTTDTFKKNPRWFSLFI